MKSWQKSGKNAPLNSTHNHITNGLKFLGGPQRSGTRGPGTSKSFSFFHLRPMQEEVEPRLKKTKAKMLP